ncbi:hypothetical protein ACO0QE_003732 [Hanseniaspora vineae]
MDTDVKMEDIDNGTVTTADTVESGATKKDAAQEDAEMVDVGSTDMKKETTNDNTEAVTKDNEVKEEETKETTQHKGLEYIAAQLTTTEFIPQIFQSLHTLKMKDTINSSNNLEKQTANIKHKIKLCKNYILTEESQTVEDNDEKITKDVLIRKLLLKTPQQWAQDIEEKHQLLATQQLSIDSLKKKIKDVLPEEM